MSLTLSLTTRILLLVLLALTPALVIQGYNEVALRTSRDAAVRADALATVRGAARISSSSRSGCGRPSTSSPGIRPCGPATPPPVKPI
ncbi:hypothetical protein [Methylobacterium sp. J-077]|uniref:hypothetical protein n=1 Tax=Methylobacterium sp. J-077 TaxID=2836656 RepID=UPI0028C379F0|nr:hypothetical protein [Methylobacterium sp. J-077]